ncbi:MAG: ABC transporter permease [Alphaproteobacteria bacterium]|nr:ABC transporter permease [Alphaproteobacteria bacterium]
MASVTGGPLVGHARSRPLSQRFRALLLRSEALRGYILLTPTLLVMFLLLVVPLCGMIAFSFFTQVYFDIDFTLTLKNYWSIIKPGAGNTYLGIPFPFETPVYTILLVKSLLMSLVATSVIVLMAYPMAYFIAFRATNHKFLWLVLITVPLWTSYLLRVFAWKVILGHNGVLNSGLISIGVIEEPLGFLLYNPAAVIITLTHAWLAFAILPIYVSLEKIDRSLLEAATDLGDSKLIRFLRVTLPLSLPGVISSALMVFIPTVGDYVTPAQVGGTSGIMIGTIIQRQFGAANNWPLGSALSIFMMLAVTAIVCLFLWGVGNDRIKARGA